MQSTVDFLEHILPDEGYYCAWILEGKRTLWFNSIRDLGSAIITADAAGQTVYHACASYREATRRLASNAHALACLYADVDAGPGKPYADARTAIEATKHFCTQTGLPFPTAVGSGYGLHIYWPLFVNLDLENWLRYATGLRSLCAEKGFHIDPVRTCDAASILRTPGTHNRKGGMAVPVVAGPLNGPFELSVFDGVKDVKAPPRRINGHKPRLASLVGTLFSNDKASGRIITQNCGQIGEYTRLRGRCLEPFRYACFGALAYCDDGEQIALENNQRKNHPDYTLEEIQGKFQQRRDRADGPTTCDKFHSLNPKTCEACPHFRKITSPITLGKNSPVQHTLQVPKRTIPGASSNSVVSDDAQRSSPNNPIILPKDFAWGPKYELVAVSEVRGGKTIEHVISHNPLYLHSVQCGEINKDYALTFKHFIPSRGWEDVSLPSGTLFSASGSSEIHAKGMVVHDFQQFSRYAKDHVNMIYEQRQVQTEFEQFGWKAAGTAFLYGDKLYSANGVHTASLGKELRQRCENNFVGVKPGASLKVWRENVDALFAKGAEAQAIAILASLAAPLIYFMDSTYEGGVILHFNTPASATGKTWGLMGAITVWSDKWGLRGTSGDTKVSRGLTLAAIGNLPIFNDEFIAKDPEQVRNQIVAFTEGKDKARATRSGHLQQQASTWQTIMMSAANQSIHDAISENNQMHPMSWRVIEINNELPKGIVLSQGDKFMRLMRENSGIAGHVFMEQLCRDDVRKWTVNRLEEVKTKLWDSGQFTPAMRYWVRGLTAMFVAGELANHLGLISFDVSRVIGWLKEELLKEHKQESERTWAVEALVEYLRTQWRTGVLTVPGPFVPHATPRASNIPSHELRVRYEVQGKRYLIAQTPLRQWLTGKEQSYKAFVKELEKVGVVRRASCLMTLGAGTDNPGPQVWCLEINGEHSLLNPVSIADHTVQATEENK